MHNLITNNNFVPGFHNGFMGKTRFNTVFRFQRSFFSHKFSILMTNRTTNHFNMAASFNKSSIDTTGSTPEEVTQRVLDALTAVEEDAP